MTQFTTELLNFLAQKQDIDEFFRSSLETAMNDLLQAELSAFLGYELKGHSYLRLQNFQLLLCSLLFSPQFF